MENKIRSILFIALFILSLVLSGCSAIKIPKSIDRSKKKIERNYEEIKAISDYHGLSSPLRVTDTITIKIPERKLDIDIPKIENRKIDSLLREYGSLVTVDPSDQQSVNDITEKILLESKIIKDTVYEDSDVIIDIKNLGDNLSIDYTIKSKEVTETVESDVIQINTKVNWYEDNYFRLILLVILLTVLFLVVYNKTKRS